MICILVTNWVNGVRFVKLWKRDPANVSRPMSAYVGDLWKFGGPEDGYTKLRQIHARGLCWFVVTLILFGIASSTP
jgi:hypothetical protein